MAFVSRTRARLGLTQLEARDVPSAVPTVAEQVFLERLNDARANPAAYGAQIGVDLGSVAPSAPLALDPRLVEAARLHAQDMNDRAYFSHTGSDGSAPWDRMTRAGYGWRSAGESISAGAATPEDVLAWLVTDAGVPSLAHRNQLLANGSQYQHREVGIGVVQNGTGPYRHYYTIDTGTTADTRPYLTGVVFADADADGKYDAGEGLNGVTITVAGVGSTAAWSTGGYSVRVNPGTYTVTASGGGLAAPVTRAVTVGSANYRLNFNPEAVSPRPVASPVVPPMSPPPPAEDTTGAHVTASTLTNPGAGNLTSARLRFAEAINPATFTAADVKLTGPRGAVTVTGVVAVAGTGNTQFDVTFAPQTAAGTYTLAVGPDVRDAAGNPMDQNRDGVNGQAGADAFTRAVAVAAPAPRATFAGWNATTKGSWVGRYGSAGYSLAQGARSLPAGTSVNPTGQWGMTWAARTSDARALQKPGAPDRFAAAWYKSSPFTVDVAASGPRRVSLYLLDWSRRGSAQRVEVLDPNTGAVLDARTVPGLPDGVYLTWKVTGPVRFRLVPVSGGSAFLSGVFLDPAA